MPSVFTPAAARSLAHPVAAPAVTADINGRAEAVRRDPQAFSLGPITPAGRPSVSFFA